MPMLLFLLHKWKNDRIKLSRKGEVLTGRFNLTGKKIAVGAVLILVAALTAYKLIPHKPALPPRTVVAKAIAATNKADRYLFNMKMTTYVGGKEGVFTEIQGERAGANVVHIKGKITESNVEFYQIKDTTYTKDQVTGEWIKIVDNQLNQEEIFAAELFPMANFNYSELAEVRYDGIVEYRNQKVWKFTAIPLVKDSYLDILWKDFIYELWVDRGSGYLTAATLKATSKTNSEDKLKVSVQFSQYGGNIDVKPPI